MFTWIKKKVKFTNSEQQQFNIPESQISSDINENIQYVNNLFDQNSDYIFRQFNISQNRQIQAFIIGIDGLFDKEDVNENILKPLMQLKVDKNNENGTLKWIQNNLININSIAVETSMEKAIGNFLKGSILLFVDGIEQVLILNVNAWEHRGITEPLTETVVRGPREGFTEILRINTSMLRRKIHNPKLQIQHLVLGKLTQTDIAIVFINDVVNPAILNEVKERLQRIEIDSILESGYIEELIEDSPFSLFTSVANTERPDVACAKILEGRIAILVDGTPFCLVVPHLFIESFQSPEDYYTRPYWSSFTRMLRILAFFIAVLTPAVYVAGQLYHKEMFPTELLISLASERQGVPFPLAIELFIMQIVFEFLREAGVRMPRPIGQAVSIVGALIIGEAAVNAGFVGAPTIIVIASAGISGLLVPALTEVISLLRLLFLIAASVFGLYGIMLLGIGLLIHLASLRSFTISYMSPIFPIIWTDWKDAFIRMPLSSMNLSPKSLQPNDQVRQKDIQNPGTNNKTQGD